jgi:hypothetical protein
MLWVLRTPPLRMRRNAHATRAPARFAGSICGTRNLGNRRNSLRSDSRRF